ncbi:MAG: putative alkyl hydroperoxide reductase [Candidatus Eremiobacteraeota bacterium]|nr:putative alkyl hydroperoxide reductase [Candidatus Eremiobacteraeota bacterium]
MCCEMRQAKAARRGAANSRRMSTNPGHASKASETRTLKIGDPAPDFTLTSHTGEEFHLAGARGGNVVVAFFPAAFTGT